jgi:hypothetical protein
MMFAISSSGTRKPPALSTPSPWALSTAMPRDLHQSLRLGVVEDRGLEPHAGGIGLVDGAHRLARDFAVLEVLQEP